MSRHIKARQLADLRARLLPPVAQIVFGPSAIQLALGAALTTLLNNPHLMQVRNLERIHRALEAMGRPVMRTPPPLPGAGLQIPPQARDRYVISFLDPHGQAWRIAAPPHAPEVFHVTAPTGRYVGRPRQILGALRVHFDYRRLRRLMDQLRNWRPPTGP